MQTLHKFIQPVVARQNSPTASRSSTADKAAQFTSVASCDVATAERYIRESDGNVQVAVNAYLSRMGVEGLSPAPSQRPVGSTVTSSDDDWEEAGAGGTA